MTKIQINKEISTQKAQNFCDPLDTLAQLGTEKSKILKNRAKAKFLQRKIILPLIDLDSPLNKSYWQTWHCNNTLLQEGNKITAKYCNNRWCPVCNRIRTAKLINGYLPEVEEKIKDPYFVTLTAPTVTGDDLQKTISERIAIFIKIKELFKHRRDFKIIGIRKLEVTYNKKTNKFHPHFHILLDGKKVSNALVDEWLKRNPKAKRYCQPIQKADKNSLMELFKYTTKMTTKIDKSKENNKTIIEVNPVALDIIYRALRKRRIFQTMGGIRLISEDIEKDDLEAVELDENNVDVWVWEQEVSDWISTQGEMMTGCKAHEEYEIIILYPD